MQKTIVGNKTIYKIGNATIEMIPPPPMTEEEKQRILDEITAVANLIYQKEAEREFLEMKSKS